MISRWQISGKTLDNKLLVSFLKKESLLNRFIDLTYFFASKTSKLKASKSDPFTSTNSPLNINGDLNAISQAFPWAASIERELFWCSIDKKYRKYVKTKKREAKYENQVR